MVGTEGPPGGARFAVSEESGWKEFFFSAAVSPRFARRAASRPSPFAAHVASACRNAFVRSGSKPATILSGLAIGFGSPESIATHAMIFVKYATFASLSFTFALLVSCASNRSGAYPVVRCTSDTMSCRNRKGGFFSSVSVSCVARTVAREGANADGKKVRETPTHRRVTRSTRRSRTDADGFWDEAFQTRGAGLARTLGLWTSGEEP